VKTPCNRLERHAAAFILSMLKTNAAGLAFAQRVRQHAVATLWGLLERRESVVGAPRERCIDAV